MDAAFYILISNIEENPSFHRVTSDRGYGRMGVWGGQTSSRSKDPTRILQGRVGLPLTEPTVSLPGAEDSGRLRRERLSPSDLHQTHAGPAHTIPGSHPAPQPPGKAAPKKSTRFLLGPHLILAFHRHRASERAISIPCSRLSKRSKPYGATSPTWRPTV